MPVNPKPKPKQFILRNDVVKILESFRRKNQKELRKQNDELVKLAILEFTKSVYNLAVLSYVLSKLVSKPRFLYKSRNEKIRNIERALYTLARHIDKYKDENIDELFNEVERAINDLEKDDPRFLKDLMAKGRLKVAATMYAQGVSLGLASEMTGVEKHDIMDYSGKTMMFDRLKDEKSIKERLKTTRKLIEG